MQFCDFFSTSVIQTTFSFVYTMYAYKHFEISISHTFTYVMGLFYRFRGKFHTKNVDVGMPV